MVKTTAVHNFLTTWAPSSFKPEELVDTRSFVPFWNMLVSVSSSNTARVSPPNARVASAEKTLLEIVFGLGRL